MLAQLCAILLFLWTPVSATARFIALVLQLYERNKLKLKPVNVTVLIFPL